MPDDPSPLFIGHAAIRHDLLASVLSNHPMVGTAGELPTWMDFSARLSEFTDTQHVVRRRSAYHPGASPADRYQKRLRRDVGGSVPRVIDKNPLNFMNLGLIAMFFPKARIIHCTRDALDTGLSNYFQRFPLYLDYAFELRNIGHFYGEYARLMGHWRQIPALKMTEVSYENLIENMEPTVRRMLDFWAGVGMNAV